VRPCIIGIGPQDAAEILRPRTVHGGVDDDSPDVPRAQILRLGREAEERVYFALLKQLDRFD
jgi:hypothetical protein